MIDTAVKTRIVATVGPASAEPAVLNALLQAGVSVLRINFSHGDLPQHEQVLGRIRQIAQRRPQPVAVLGDLCGPKIRLGRLTGGQCTLAEGATVLFQRAETVGTSDRLWCGYPGFVDDVQPGHRVLIDDGSLLLRAVGKTADELTCRVEIGGIVSDHKGINLPDTRVAAPALTAKDQRDLLWAITHQLDYVALSFVREPADLAELRGIIASHDSPLRIVAKIEKPQAIEHLDEIIRLSDGVMVARGDLGVEMDLAAVPLVQKDIVRRCRRAGKPVIIATQMLQSMIEHATPTRAEVSDVANAILDGTDAVMLSAETSVGRYPVEAARQMHEIARRTETFETQSLEELHPSISTINDTSALPVASALVHGVAVVARALRPPLVAVWTERGHTPALLSKHRLPCPVVALAAEAALARRLALHYGVVPLVQQRPGAVSDMLALMDRTLIAGGLAQPGDQILVVADLRPDMPGETDAMLLHVVGSLRV